MTAQPATQTTFCDSYRLELITGTADIRGLHRTRLCALHAKAEATARERDALLRALVRIEKKAKPRYSTHSLGVQATNAALDSIEAEAREAIAAAKGGAG